MSQKGFESQRRWTKMRTLVRGGRASYLPRPLYSVEEAVRRAGLPP